MEVLTKCGRCGALVETRKTKFGDGTVAYYAPCAAVTEISSNNTLVREGCEVTPLCPDCMEQLKAWLAGESEGQQEADGIAENESGESLVRDMARALDFLSDHSYSACRYFGNKPECHGCPANTGAGSRGCCNAMLDDIDRRCDKLGIDLEEGEDAGK